MNPASKSSGQRLCLRRPGSLADRACSGNAESRHPTIGAAQCRHRCSLGPEPGRIYSGGPRRKYRRPCLPGERCTPVSNQRAQLESSQLHPPYLSPGPERTTPKSQRLKPPGPEARKARSIWHFACLLPRLTLTQGRRPWWTAGLTFDLALDFCTCPVFPDNRSDRRKR